MKKKKKQNPLKRYKFYNGRYGNKEDWKPKPYKDLEMEDIQNRRFLPKALFFDHNLSMADKSVYTVMCCLANFKKNVSFHRSQETISRMAGLSVDTVKKAINHLRHAGLVQAKKRNDIWRYRIWFPRSGDITEWEGQAFWFHRCIIDTGLWGKLTLRQQVFYLGSRSEGKVDPEVHEEIMEAVHWSDHDITYKEWFPWRRYDRWEGSRRKLLKRLGIKPVNIKREVIEPLEDHGLVEQLPMYYKSAYRVYLRPKDQNQWVKASVKEEILHHERHFT